MCPTLTLGMSMGPFLQELRTFPPYLFFIEGRALSFLGLMEGDECDAANFFAALP